MFLLLKILDNTSNGHATNIHLCLNKLSWEKKISKEVGYKDASESMNIIQCFKPQHLPLSKQVILNLEQDL